MLITLTILYNLNYIINIVLLVGLPILVLSLWDFFRQKNYYYIKFLIISIAVANIFLLNAECGTAPHINTIATIEETVAHMNDQQLAEFADRIGVPRQRLLDNIQEQQRLLETGEDLQRVQARWDAVILFVAATALVYLWVFHRHQIMEYLFNAATNAGQLASDSTYSIIKFAARTVGRHVIETPVVAHANALLENPATAETVRLALLDMGVIPRL